MRPIRTPSVWANQARTTALLQQKQRVQKAETVAITGQRIERPSDDPAAWPEVHALEAGLNRQAVYNDNASFAANALLVADGSLDMASDLLSQARELAVAASSDTLAPNERIGLATQAEQLLEQLRTQGNTELGGRYLFGGTATNAPPFAADGVYQGTGDPALVEVSPGVQVEVGFDGEALFSNALKTMDDLVRAMQTGDADAVGAVLDPLRQDSEALVHQRGRIGLEWQAADDAQTLGLRVEESLTARHSELLGADPVEAFSQLAQLRTSYEAAMAVTASSQQTNLFDLIR